MCYRSQGITLLHTAGTPTPSNLRSSWNFLLGRSPDMLVGTTPPKFLAREGGLDDKMSPQSLF